MSFKITLKAEKEKVVVFSDGTEVLESHIKRVFSKLSDAEWQVNSAVVVNATIDLASVGENVYSITFALQNDETEKMENFTEIFKSDLDPSKVIEARMPELADFKELKLLTGEIFFQ